MMNMTMKMKLMEIFKHFGKFTHLVDLSRKWKHHGFEFHQRMTT